MKPGTSLETKMTKLRLSYFGHNKRRLKFKRAAMEIVRKITKNKNVSLETKAKITHILIFPLTMYSCKS